MSSVEDDRALMAPLSKKCRRSASIHDLPDECLAEILKRLPGRRERSLCARVSKRWLMLLVGSAADDECVARPRRSFKGKAASDVRIAAAAVGGGGCDELLIQASMSCSDIGLSALSRGFPSLRVLSLQLCPLVGDEGLVQIARGCPLLQKLELRYCPGLSDRGVAAIASSCVNLLTVTIESCAQIGDRGVAGLFSAARRVKLESLPVSDAALAVAGLEGKSVAELTLDGLPNVTERGLWVMASAGGLGAALTHLTVASCDGLTDMSLEAAAKGFPLLTNLCLRRSSRLSDSGIKAFAAAASSLESLRLEDCRRLSLAGVLDAVLSCSGNLKALSVAGCAGERDGPQACPPRTYPSLRSLSIRRCRGLGDDGLATVARLCPRLQHVDLRGNVDVTGRGVRRLVEDVEPQLARVDLGGCSNVTDEAVTALAARHGASLRALSLEGCARVTDRSLAAVAEFCGTLRDLDVSRCGVSDEGVALLASSRVLDLQVLSLSGCARVSEGSVPYLSSLGQSLVGLGLQRCSSIGTRAMSALQDAMWWCDILC